MRPDRKGGVGVSGLPRGGTQAGIIRPAVEGAFLLAMALSIDEFVISLFTAGNDTTLPLLIWAKMRRGSDPTTNAIATLMLVGTVGLSLVAARRAAARGG